MFIRLANRKAQTTAEYAILFGLVVGALLAMQIYIRRGLQGRLKDAVDHTGAGGVVAGEELTFSTGQYEPYYLTSSTSNTQSSNESENVKEGGEASKTSNASTSATRSTTVGWTGSE